MLNFCFYKNMSFKYMNMYSTKNVRSGFSNIWNKNILPMAIKVMNLFAFYNCIIPIGFGKMFSF